MSKNFEEEFKAYAVEDIPDLWSRIEPALAKKAHSGQKEIKKEEIKEEAKEAVKEEKELSVKKQADTPKKKVSAKKVFSIMVPSLSAAALIILLLPMFLFPIFGNKSYSDSGPNSAGGADYSFASDKSGFTQGIAAQDDAEGYVADECETANSVTAGGKVNTADTGNGGNDETVEEIGIMENGYASQKEDDAQRPFVTVRAEAIKVLERDGYWICQIRLLEALPEDFPIHKDSEEKLNTIFYGVKDEVPVAGEVYEVKLEYREEERIPIILTYAEE